MIPSKNSLPTWMSAASRVDIDSKISSMSDSSSTSSNSATSSSEPAMGFGERALSAAGAAVLSAIIVNPLDVAKTRLQAQAAGVLSNSTEEHFIGRMSMVTPNTLFSDFRCSTSCTRAGLFGTAKFCPPDCFQYKGTLDVFYKVARQEGIARLWRGTAAALALSVPTVGIYLPCYDVFRDRIEDYTSVNAPSLTPYAPLVAGSAARSLACIVCSPIELARTRMQAFKAMRDGGKPPGVLKTLIGVLPPISSTNINQSFQNYRALWLGVGAQLARDVPFSAICWSTLEPTRRKLLKLVGEDANAATILGANFSAGFVAGSIAAAATCPLDVAKTRRQVEKDVEKALKMTTRKTLVDIWRDGGIKGLFTGVWPRVVRAGPSVGIVVSFYEVVKYTLHQRHSTHLNRRIGTYDA